MLDKLQKAISVVLLATISNKLTLFFACFVVFAPFATINIPLVPVIFLRGHFWKFRGISYLFSFWERPPLHSPREICIYVTPQETNTSRTPEMVHNTLPVFLRHRWRRMVRWIKGRSYLNLPTTPYEVWSSQTSPEQVTWNTRYQMTHTNQVSWLKSCFKFTFIQRE